MYHIMFHMRFRFGFFVSSVDNSWKGKYGSHTSVNVQLIKHQNGIKWDLSDFDHGINVGAGQAGLSSSETADLLSFSPATVSRVYTKKNKKQNHMQWAKVMLLKTSDWCERSFENGPPGWSWRDFHGNSNGDSLHSWWAEKHLRINNTLKIEVVELQQQRTTSQE